MKRYLALMILALGMAACARNCPTMDTCYFAQVDIGDAIDDVIACAGCPHDVCDDCCDGQKKYVYISRRDVAPGVKRYHTYIFTVDDDGVIVDKSIEVEEDHELFFSERNIGPRRGMF